MIRLLLAVIAITITAGCGTLGQDVKMQTYKIVTNYKINETVTSNIGSAMIRAEDIIVDEYASALNKPFFQSKYGFEVTGAFQSRRHINVPNRSFTFKTGTLIHVVGNIILDGENYYAIPLKDTEYLLLVTDSGLLIKNKFLKRDGDHFNYIDIKLKTIPDEIRFDFLPALDRKYRAVTKFGSPGSFRLSYIYEDIIYEPRPRNIPEVNYELIYGGKDSAGLHITYREYTSEGLAKQAFYQNLNYENNANTIQFKNTNIKILSSDNGKITFKVLEDDFAVLEKIGNAELSKHLGNP